MLRELLEINPELVDQSIHKFISLFDIFLAALEYTLDMLQFKDSNFETQVFSNLQGPKGQSSGYTCQEGVILTSLYLLLVNLYLRYTLESPNGFLLSTAVARGYKEKCCKLAMNLWTISQKSADLKHDHVMSNKLDCWHLSPVRDSDEGNCLLQLPLGRQYIHSQ